jgi:hypothetical protein
MAEVLVAHTAVTASAFAVAFFCSLTATLAIPVLVFTVVHVLFDGCRCCRSIIHISMLTTRASFEVSQKIQFLLLEDCRVPETAL